MLFEQRPTELLILAAVVVEVEVLIQEQVEVALLLFATQIHIQLQPLQQDRLQLPHQADTEFINGPAQEALLFKEI
jgi:hypothetical protein